MSILRFDKIFSARFSSCDNSEDKKNADGNLSNSTSCQIALLLFTSVFSVETVVSDLLPRSPKWGSRLKILAQAFQSCQSLSAAFSCHSR